MLAKLLLALLPHGLCLHVREAKAPLVPFFMYELPAWVASCNREQMRHQNFFPDVALHQTLQDHPWRVASGDDAKLLVVPGYFGLSKAGRCGNHTANMEESVAALESQPFLRTRLGDHLFSCFHMFCTLPSLGPFGKYAQAMIAAHVEGGPLDELTRRLGALPRLLVVPYGPLSARGDVPKVPKRKSLFFIGQADSRTAYKERRRAIGPLSSSYRDSVLRAVPMDAWPALPMCRSALVETHCRMEPSFEEYARAGAECRYGLVIHGDTPSTSRLYDTFALEQLPIVVSDLFLRRAAPFRSELPWEELLAFVPQRDFEADAAGSVGLAVAQWANASKAALWKRARPFLDWSLRSPCLGTALLTSAARQFLAMDGLPRAFDSEQCRK